MLSKCLYKNSFQGSRWEDGLWQSEPMYHSRFLIGPQWMLTAACLLSNREHHKTANAHQWGGRGHRHPQPEAVAGQPVTCVLRLPTRNRSEDHLASFHFLLHGLMFMRLFLSENTGLIFQHFVTGNVVSVNCALLKSLMLRTSQNYQSDSMRSSK